MAFDEAHSRLFVGCRNPASVVVLDSNTGREVPTFPSALKPTTCSTMGRINEYMSPGPKAHSTWWSKWTLSITASSQDWRPVRWHATAPSCTHLTDSALP